MGLNAPLPLKWAGPWKGGWDRREGVLAVVKSVRYLTLYQKDPLPSPPPPRLPTPKHPVTSQIRTILEAVFASLTFQNSIKEAKDS